MAIILFPYDTVSPLEVPDRNLMGIFSPPPRETALTEQELLASALASPVGVPPLAEVLKTKRRVMLVSDDHHRPTPVRKMLPFLLDELRKAGVPREGIEIVMALGSHRLMQESEIREKVGSEIVDGFKVSNHDWTDAENLYFAGRVPPGIDVWVNKKMREFDYIIGLGQIMPMDVCGFTGGCNIIIPGLCGPKTSSDFHWIRTGIPAAQVVGLRENPIREAIDNSAMVAGLSAILNVVLDDEGKICHAVYGHPVEAHKAAVPYALKAHSALLPHKSDIVICDGFPFDVEFWQVNKALTTRHLLYGPAASSSSFLPAMRECRQHTARTFFGSGTGAKRRSSVSLKRANSSTVSRQST